VIKSVFERSLALLVMTELLFHELRGELFTLREKLFGHNAA
jgi:hypothetical protein